MPKVSINLAPVATDELDKRTGPRERSSRVSTDLERYYEALKRARAEIAPLFTPGELALVVNESHGVLYEPYSIALLQHGIADGINLDPSATQKWEVNGAALVDKLTGLTYIQKAALIDAVERFWTRAGSGNGATDDPGKILVF